MYQEIDDNLPFSSKTKFTGMNLIPLSRKRGALFFFNYLHLLYISHQHCFFNFRLPRSLIVLYHYISFILYYTLYFYFCIHYSMHTTKSLVSIHHHTIDPLCPFCPPATISPLVTTTLFSISMWFWFLFIFHI